MAKNPKDPKGSGDVADNQTAATDSAAAGTAGAAPQDVSVPVDGQAAAPAEGTEKKPAKPSIPEHLKKGNRVCAACGTTEAEFLAKNPRYSLCQGVDVLCYRKGHRVIYGATLEDVNAKYPDKVGQVDETTKLPLISEVSGTGIKPGILVRGAISYKRKAVDTAAAGTQAPAAAGEATGSAGTTSAG
jgi:hypothetical protein